MPLDLGDRHAINPGLPQGPALAIPDQTGWESLLEKLIERGLDPERVQLVVSDGSTGLVPALANYLPQAQQQRCITHKVRRIVDHLNYLAVP